MAGGRCYIGTSGWSYAHWAKGRFHPKGLRQGQWLGFFAERFDTVEVNSSFHRLPKPEFVARWRSVTRTRFRFAAKLWRRITHEKRLLDCETELSSFLELAARHDREAVLLLVGHLPHLARLAGLLLTGDAGRTPGRFVNAGVLKIDSTQDGWAVEWYVTPPGVR